jgi:hypothetical protein
MLAVARAAQRIPELSGAVCMHQVVQEKSMIFRLRCAHKIHTKSCKTSCSSPFMTIQVHERSIHWTPTRSARVRLLHGLGLLRRRCYAPRRFLQQLGINFLYW